MSDAEQNIKPETSEDNQLNIKVKDADGFEVFFKVKKTTKLSKLKKAYAERMGKPVSSVRFMFDGARVNDEDTADTLGLEDQDEIDAMIEQLGGMSL
ncbi:ubiquitin-like protein [Tilletiaria anomala UBC 951]|uniref:Ubiquitin-like protein n=1 Tax=Tilletiaria anomala (strain ATCC 24038 / CBS 436.72 / UBC 951) TaxID=1037660 RepID=A0A066VCL9_TILAU|nr:ubiquitin-like protein [Tilletiaria anomala UBC 951]KDN38043.1 ubiquitin-like protein [Tilletiaria anomala UBC 951]